LVFINLRTSFSLFLPIVSIVCFKLNHLDFLSKQLRAFGFEKFSSVVTFCNRHRQYMWTLADVSASNITNKPVHRLLMHSCDALM